MSHLLADLRHRTIVMTYYPRSFVIKKWAREFLDERVSNSGKEYPEYYTGAIQEALRRNNDGPRASKIHSGYVLGDTVEWLVDPLRHKIPEDKLQSNPLYEIGKEELTLPIGLR